MSDNLTLIANRRSEVLKIIAEAKKAQEAGEAELAELDVAGRTFARLTGAIWPPAGQGDATTPPTLIGGRAQPAAQISIAETILNLVKEMRDYAELIGGLAPKDIKQELENRGKRVRGEYVSTTMWRLAERGELVKLGNGRYELAKQNPEKDRATEPAKL